MKSRNNRCTEGAKLREQDQGEDPEEISPHECHDAKNENKYSPKYNALTLNNCGSV